MKTIASAFSLAAIAVALVAGNSAAGGHTFEAVSLTGHLR